LGRFAPVFKRKFQMNTQRFKTQSIAGTLILAGLVSGQVMAQVADATATAAVNATVLTPISITQEADLKFGSFAIDATNAGTVVISAINGARSFTGGAAVVPASASDFNTAEFNIAGEANATFSVLLPASVLLTGPAGSTLTVDAFTVGIDGIQKVLETNATTGVIKENGKANMLVAATLNVIAGTPAGTYANATGLQVTVAYN